MSLVSEMPLTADEYYHNALRALAMESGEEQLATIGDIDLNVAAHHVRLSREQALDIKTRAMSLFKTGNAEPLLGFFWLFTVAGILTPEKGFWAPYSEGHEVYYSSGCTASLLREVGILEADERVSVVDSHFMEVGNRGIPPIGTLLLTDRRMLMHGVLVPPHEYMDATYRLYYDEHESMPWLSSVDHLMLDRIVSIESKWGLLKKNIFVEYQTKYIKERFHTLFGPYFFKWRLPSTISVSEGVLTIVLSPSPFVKVDPRMRQEELVKRVKEAKAALGSLGP